MSEPPGVTLHRGDTADTCFVSKTAGGTCLLVMENGDGETELIQAAYFTVCGRVGDPHNAETYFPRFILSSPKHIAIWMKTLVNVGVDTFGSEELQQALEDQGFKPDDEDPTLPIGNFL